MAHEQLVVELARRLVRLARVHPRLGGGGVLSAGEDGHGDDQTAPVGREAEAVDVEREVGHLHRIDGGTDDGDACRIAEERSSHAPDLLRPSASGQEEEAVVVRRPPWRAGSVASGLERIGVRVGTPQVPDPDRRHAAVLLQVRPAHHEGDRLAVRRHVRVARAVKAYEIRRGERAGGGGGRCDQDACEGERQEAKGGHDGLLRVAAADG